MANVTKALVLVVLVVPAWVRTLKAAATKMDVGVTPHTEGGPIVLTGREWKTSNMIAEPRLYTKKSNKKTTTNKKEKLLTFSHM